MTTNCVKKKKKKFHIYFLFIFFSIKKIFRKGKLDGIDSLLFKTSLYPYTYDSYKKSEANMSDKEKRKKSKKFVRSLFPIIDWFPIYLKKWKKNVRSDLIAGLTVGFMIITQGNFFFNLYFFYFLFF